jgi:hypothetical protein
MSETPDEEKQPRFAEVVYTQDELTALLEEKAHNWRWAAFVSVLVQRRAALESRFRDHELRYASPTGERARDGMAVVQFAIDALRDFNQLAAQLTDFMLSPPFMAVFGERDDEDTADADGLVHTANRLMDYYERFLVFSEIARGLAAPTEYADLLNDCALMADCGFEGYHEFIDKFVALVGEMPAILIEANGQDVELEPIVLHLKPNDEVLSRIVARVRQISDSAA